MRDESGAGPIEPRWPAALAIVVVLALFALLPGRVRLLPAWCAYALGLAMLATIGAVGVSRGRSAPRRTERFATLVFFAFTTSGTLVNLANVIREILHPSGAVVGIELLASSIAIWVTN